jgi:signal transduction histidine kinase
MSKSAATARPSDALVRGILESIDSRIAVLDGAGRVVALNNAWQRFDDVRIAGGYAPVRIGDNYLEMLDALAADHRPGFPEAAAAARRMIARQAPFAEVDYRVDTSGGGRWFVARLTPLDAIPGGVVVSHEDVTERVAAHRALQEAHARLKSLSSKVLSIQEEERRAISRELHDDVGQSLAALGIALHRASAGKAGAGDLAECASIVESVLERIRAIAHDLRPPQLEQLGLADALRWLAERHARATGARIICDFAKAGAWRLAPAVEIACYRIAQEAINNATRHAGECSIAIGLKRRAGALELSVRDDGAGFDMEAVRSRDPRNGSLGIIGMQERAELVGGTFDIRSGAGAGTTVTARFPIEAA